MWGSCRKLPEEDLPKPFWNQHSWLRHGKRFGQILRCCWTSRTQETRKALLRPAPEIIRTWETQIVPPVGPLGPPQCFGAQRTFHNHLPNALNSPESHKPHAANSISLVICFAGIPASRAMQTSHAHRGIRCRVMQGYFFQGFEPFSWVFKQPSITAQQRCSPNNLCLPGCPPSWGIKPCTVHL